MDVRTCEQYVLAKLEEAEAEVARLEAALDAVPSFEEGAWAGGPVEACRWIAASVDEARDWAEGRCMDAEGLRLAALDPEMEAAAERLLQVQVKEFPISLREGGFLWGLQPMHDVPALLDGLIMEPKGAPEEFRWHPAESAEACRAAGLETLRARMLAAADGMEAER